MASEEQRAEEAVREAFLRLTEGYIGRATRDDLMMAAALSAKTMSRGVAAPPRDRKRRRSLMAFALLLCGWIYGGGSFERGGAAGPLRSLQGTRCLLPNNYLVWEFTRPVSSCDYCRDVGAPLVLPENLTREEFAAYSYSSRPMIVKNATHDWPARDHFTLQFFRELYERTEGAYESVEEECQFLHFKSDFANLREVFAMSERRASHSDGESAWYVGWKNCHPRILDAMGRFYSAPRFLPEDAEIPYSNYVFLGYEEGAVMHVSDSRARGNSQER